MRWGEDARVRSAPLFRAAQEEKMQSMRRGARLLAGVKPEVYAGALAP